MGSYTKQPDISDGTIAISSHINRVNNAVDTAFTTVDSNVVNINGEAELWANEVEDTPVVSGEYSALHYANKSSEWAIGAKVDGTTIDPAFSTNNSKYFKEQAELAKTASEAAQGLSENARDASVVAKDASVTAQGLSEDARDASQLAQTYSSEYALQTVDTLGTNTGTYSSLHYQTYASEYAITPENTLGAHTGVYSCLHYNAKTTADLALTNADVTYSAEWAISPNLISVAAGGDGTTDRSAKYHADDAATTVNLKFQSINLKVYTSSDTWVKPANLLYAIVEMVGGGGAGGGSDDTLVNYISAGGGGGGGGYSKRLLQASELNSSAAVTVGAGGLAVTDGTGGTGGQSSFSSLLYASGGGGGLRVASDDWGFIAKGGGGGVGTGGDFNTTGGIGASSVVNSAERTVNDNARCYSGGGGSSLLGGGAVPVNGDNDIGVTATGYGGGGSGAASVEDAGTNNPGGAGAPGVVIITEYLGA